VEVYGTTGTAVLEREHLLTVTDASGRVERRDRSPAAHTSQHPSRGALGVWAAQVVDAVRCGRQLSPSFVDGLRVQEVMAAALRSHDLGGTEVVVDRRPVPA
jgi:predicted dehydrogenase